MNSAKTTIIDESINALLTPAVIERTAEVLAELEPDNLPNGFDPFALNSVYSVNSWFGSTAGPFGGVGGAAMTVFRLTVIFSPEIMLLFANDRFYGVAGFRAELLGELDPDQFLRITV
ncbi:hypothetical protein Achl_4070 (plasmid) [Pseudarthrobacter chlorophenolicus A6]|uniref:Uncharacterized protein n=1 Tax=Pseudarthrobacter chlorophenolicus (strain ATCC 700700 / DSM 12829 / CIP 107037 / JCM 12360 / KCTC 9906 / NCIMB 13794 / A6) TaxID=452863 RepID=B8HHX4_PSECP|nr:hypothetical protein [Pseudarthrobacter chlorophenolicus]ACL42021.1 hypothetical protein Achl_4070 [Pseudarthrobacter chlorophenolicus A6]SDQ20433.1 hypothetical protein SAMN04489738_0721 [Pseudarthrobacter chlorophenolicus]